MQRRTGREEHKVRGRSGQGQHVIAFIFLTCDRIMEMEDYVGCSGKAAALLIFAF